MTCHPGGGFKDALTQIGWLASLTGRRGCPCAGLLGRAGIVGAFIGGFIFSSLRDFFGYVEGFNRPSIVVATVGAVVLLAVFGGSRNRRILH